MNEQKFVQFLKENFKFSKGKGIGDDSSVYKLNDYYQLITNDILIENIHFNINHFSTNELAMKSLAVNISDIVAMGGEPEYFYIGLGFPKRLKEKDLNDFYNGLKLGCNKWGIELAGGDFSGSDKMFISITMVGKTEHPIYRENAKNGDLIAITRGTGESALGLKCLKNKIDSKYFINKHKKVIPDIKKGRLLSKYVNSMIDVSDGLLLDLKRILNSSKKGAKIFYENIPVSKKLSSFCLKYNFNEYEFVLSGGEDYVLLFTISPKNELYLKKENTQYYIIGQVNNNQGELIVKHKNKTIKLKDYGYDHFLHL